MPGMNCPRQTAPTWAYGRCDYVRYGAAILTASIYALAWSPVLLVPAPTALIFWCALTFVGVVFAGFGGAAVRSHADFFDGRSLVWSTVIAAIAFCGISAEWSLPRAFGPWLICASHGALYVLLVYGVAGVALQIRNLIPQRQRQTLATTNATVEVARLHQQVATLTAERDTALATARHQPHDRGEVTKLRTEVSAWKTRCQTAEQTRDRYQENGRRALHHAQKMEALLLAPGIEAALTKAIHSDVGRAHKSAEEIRARDAAFVQMREIYDQLKHSRR